jgi:hypothetical protein
MKPFLHYLFGLLFFSTGFIAPHAAAQVQTGKSYANISKGNTGGTFEPGDTLEIRSCIAVGSFTAFSIAQVRYNDTIGTNFTYIPGTLKIMTNEGLTFRSFTDAANDDKGMFDATTKTLRINLGSTATNAASTGNAAATGGTIAHNNKPSFYGGVCIMVASFRVKINSTLTYNTLISLPGGAFRYTDGASAVTVPFTTYKMMLVKNLPSCSDYFGSNVLVENGGSFSSGTTQNRSSSVLVPGYTFANFASGAPNDGFYGVCNNTSANGSTSNAVAIPNSARVFTVWDIIGDHTGAASPTTGNIAQAPGTNGGYMAVVNASYAISRAVQQSVTNVCPSTYYDFSAWFRNICSRCACDSNGNGAMNASFNGPDKAGVKPNLTYQIDDVDYYTTGNLTYTGMWSKKGFTYLTGAAQTSFSLTIRNNSPGGGGNDWAMDDVTLASCQPNVNMNITPELLGCPGTQVDFKATVSSYYNNYSFYKWQKMAYGSSSWVSAGVAGTEIPVLAGGKWQYTVAFPSFVANKTDSGSRYRIVAATTALNLDNNSCAFSNNNSTLLKIINCTGPLDVQLKNLVAQLINKKTILSWQYINGGSIQSFEIEKSTDGRHYEKIGVVQSMPSAEITSYQFAGDVEISRPSFYRLKIVKSNNLYSYSNVLFIDPGQGLFSLGNFSNPFHNEIAIEYVVPLAGKINCRVLNATGRLISQKNFDAVKGFNKNSFDGLQKLSPGLYTFTLIYGNNIISKRVVKIN